MKLPNIEDTELIQSASKTDGRVTLSVLDVVQNNIWVDGLFLFPESTPYEHLRESLKATLEDFPILTGRMIPPSKRPIHIEIHCNNAGIPLEKASSELTLKRISSLPIEEKSLATLIPKCNPKQIQSQHAPLGVIRITYLAEGAMAIGIAVIHSIADGESLAILMHNWSSKHEKRAPLKPTHERTSIETFASNALVKHQVSESIPEFIYKNTWRFIWTFVRYIWSARNVKRLVIHYTPEDINCLKSQAAAYNPEIRISKIDALTVHLWKVMTEIRQLPPSMTVKLFSVLSARFMAPDKISPTLFGNAVSHLSYEEKVENILKFPLGKLAQKLRSIQNAMVPATIEPWMTWLKSRQEDGTLVRVLPNLAPLDGDLFFTNLTPLNKGSSSFGGVKASHVLSNNVPIPWTIRLYPDLNMTGAIYVHVSLPKQYLRRLQSTSWQKKLKPTA